MNLPTAQLIPSKPVLLRHHTVDNSNSIIASVGSESGSSSTSSIHSLYPPLKLRAPLAFKGSLTAIHPLEASSLLFLIDGKGNKVLLWNDVIEEIMLELAFKDAVLALRSRRDKLVVVLRRRIILFSINLMSDDRADLLVREGEYATVDNPLGLAAIATAPGSVLLAFPGRQAGHVQMVRLPPLGAHTNTAYFIDPNTALPPYPSIHIFLAHTSSLRTLILSATGSMLCTSSTKGTLLRVFNTANRQLVRELRRGTDQADIWSVAFSDQNTGEMVACSSDKNTIHVWHVGNLLSLSDSSTNPNPRRREDSSDGIKDKPLNLLKPYLPAYFSSQWSDLIWRIPTVNGSGREASARGEDDIAICIFVSSNPQLEQAQKDQLLVVTRSGAWYRLSTFSTPAPIEIGSAEHASGNLGVNPAPTMRSLKGKTKEEEKHCIMLEYRRLWQGMGDDDNDEDWSDDE